MDEANVQRVIGYHDRTKHHPQRYARGPGRLDWANQPDPFRTYAGCERVPLPVPPDDFGPTYRQFVAGRPQVEPLGLESVSRFLYLSLAISAWKQYGSSRWALRCNPSSGNLHPTEGYLVLPAIEGIGDAPGVYHYCPKDHALERRAVLRCDDWRRLMPPGCEALLLVGLTSIHWREAWKYGERAFRYCQLDIGHAVGALRFAAAALGWNLRIWLEPSDEQIARLLGLEHGGEPAAAGQRTNGGQPPPAGQTTVASDLRVRREPDDARRVGQRRPTLRKEHGGQPPPAGDAKHGGQPPPAGNGGRSPSTGPAVPSPATSHDPEREWPELLAVVWPADRAPARWPDAAAIDALASAARWSGTPNRLSRAHVRWEVIEVVAEATRRPTVHGGQSPAAGQAKDGGQPPPAGQAKDGGRSPSTGQTPVASDLRVRREPDDARSVGQGRPTLQDRNDGQSRATAPQEPPELPPAPHNDHPAARIIRTRRSALAMDGRTGMPLRAFERLCRRVLPDDPAARVPFDAWACAPAVHLLWFVHRIEGLDPGLYLLVRAPQAEPLLRDAIRAAFDSQPVEPLRSLPLWRLRRCDCRKAAALLSLGQDIAGDSAVAAAMLAEFEPRLREAGPWFYRALHWEAGLLGQVLYLEAEALGLRATGIGAFFDDWVHTTLGITDPRVQTIYHFTIGGPVEDKRLTTLPAYESGSRPE